MRGCLDSTHCAGVNGSPFCNTTSHTCVECLTDGACGVDVASPAAAFLARGMRIARIIPARRSAPPPAARRATR